VCEQEWATVWDHLVRIMAAAVERGGAEVTTEPAGRSPGGEPVRREDAFYLFRRTGQPCRVCGTAIRAEPMGGRAVWWCPTCQPG
jgi:formamidopyrimidine-DNA glycosylase